MEDAVCTWLAEAQADEGESRDDHHRSDSLYTISYGRRWRFNVEAYPEPVRTMSGDGNVGSPAIVGVGINSESVVAHLCYQKTLITVV